MYLGIGIMMYVFVPGNVHEGTFGRTIIESSSSSPPPLTSLIVYKKEILKFTGYMYVYIVPCGTLHLHHLRMHNIHIHTVCIV